MPGKNGTVEEQAMVIGAFWESVFGHEVYTVEVFFPGSTVCYEIRQCEPGWSPCLHRSGVLGSSLYQL